MEVAVLGSPSLIVLMVSVDEKQHLAFWRVFSEPRSCVKRGGRAGLPVPNSPYGLCEQKEVGVLGSLSLIVHTVSVNKKRWACWAPCP